jgi:hypothetical protein
VSTIAAARGEKGRETAGAEHLRRALLACGVAAFVLYISMDLIASQLYDGYSYRDQTISELSEIGAQTRAFWIPLGFVYSALMVAFAIGIWVSAGDRRALRFVAVMACAVGVIGFVGWPLAPMHQREVLAAGGGDIRDTMHLVLGGVNSVIFMVSMAVGATALGKRFRLYTLAWLGVILVFGFLTWANAGGVDDNDATPWLGVYERIAVEGSMFWFAMLAVALLHERPRS